MSVKLLVNLKALCGYMLMLILKIFNHLLPPGSTLIFLIPWLDLHPQELMTMVTSLEETLLLGPMGFAL